MMGNPLAERIDAPPYVANPGFHKDPAGAGLMRGAAFGRLVGAGASVEALAAG